jgi:hypothetical protein
MPISCKVLLMQILFVLVSTGRSSDDVQRIRRWFWITVEKMNNIDKQDLVSDISLFAGS